MNARIRELADEASLYAVSDNSSMLFDVWKKRYTEKFAQLIAADCADICMEMAAKCAGLPGDGALAKDCAYWIKQDFGVAE